MKKICLFSATALMLASCVTRLTLSDPSVLSDLSDPSDLSLLSVLSDPSDLSDLSD